jgi:hypothetical protein
MSRQRKVLASVLLALGLAAVLGFSSFATWNAETDNPNNIFSDGTLVLSNTKQGGSACLSTGGGATDTNVNTAFDQLFNLTVKKPGDSGSANLTLKNVGSIDASTFKVFSPACTNANNSETYHGSGNPCSSIQLTLQRWTDNTFTTPSACLYGGATGATCNFSDTTKTLSAFATAYPSSASGLAIAGGLAANASAYVTVAVQLPSTADNTFQGRQASLNFDWYVAQ